jgi:hypothetical protein
LMKLPSGGHFARCWRRTTLGDWVGGGNRDVQKTQVLCRFPIDHLISFLAKAWKVFDFLITNRDINPIGSTPTCQKNERIVELFKLPLNIFGRKVTITPSSSFQLPHRFDRCHPRSERVFLIEMSVGDMLRKREQISELISK